MPLISPQKKKKARMGQCCKVNTVVVGTILILTLKELVYTKKSHN